VACSTPTHAADALVPVDIGLARGDLRAQAHCAARVSTGAVAARGRRLAELARGPARSVRLERARLHQLLRETRASAARGQAERAALAQRHALVLTRKLDAFKNATLKGEAQRLEALVLAERAHDPERTLERGYAVVTGEDGDPLTTAEAARAHDGVDIRFADGSVPARIEDHDEA
jgi:exodeoxyribonuclease VII large subunit